VSTTSAEVTAANEDERRVHDAAIRAANWAMHDDPACAAAHQRRMATKQELELAGRHEIPKARAAFEAANAEWRRITTEVFDRVMEGWVSAMMPSKSAAASTVPRPWHWRRRTSW
jgi:hypothetical protein